MAGTRKRIRLSLFYRILFLLLVVSLVPLSVTGYLLHERTDRDLNRMAEHDMGLRADRAAAEISTLVEQHQRILQSVASTPNLASMSKANQEKLVVSVQQTNPDFALVLTIGPNGQDIARSDHAPSRPYGDLAYIKAAFKGEPYAYQVAISRTTGRPTLEMAVPIKEANVVRSVLVGALDLEKVGLFLQKVQVGETEYAWLVGADDRIIVHPDMEKVKLRTGMAEHPAVAQARAGGVTSINFTADEREWMGVSRLLPGGWVLVVQTERAEIMQTLDSFNRLFVALMAIALAAVVVLALIASRDLTKPIRRMANLAGALAEGDLTATLDLERSDELGEMAESLRQMRDKLRMHVGSMSKTASRVSATAGNLGVAGAVAAESGRAVSQAFAQTQNEVQELLRQQRERLDATKAVVVELANAVEQIAQTASDQAGEVSRAAAIVADLVRRAEVVASGVGRLAGATSHQAVAFPEEARRMQDAVFGLVEGHGRLAQTMEMLAAVAEENSAAAEEMAAGAETARDQVQQLDTLALQNFASIQAVEPEMKSILRAIDQVVGMIGRLDAIKTELVESTATLRA